jgi:hypothetical protein
MSASETCGPTIGAVDMVGKVEHAISMTAAHASDTILSLFLDLSTVTNYVYGQSIAV